MMFPALGQDSAAKQDLQSQQHPGGAQHPGGHYHTPVPAPHPIKPTPGAGQTTPL